MHMFNMSTLLKLIFGKIKYIKIFTSESSILVNCLSSISCHFVKESFFFLHQTSSYMYICLICLHCVSEVLD